MLRRLAVTTGILLCSAFVGNAAIQEMHNAEPFVRDPNMPFVYLKFDHIGRGVRRSENEPSTRIWLQFVNNCKVAIRLRTYGVPEGSVVGEIGVMDEVTPDPPMLTIISGHDQYAPNFRLIAIFRLRSLPHLADRNGNTKAP